VILTAVCFPRSASVETQYPRSRSGLKSSCCTITPLPTGDSPSASASAGWEDWLLPDMWVSLACNAVGLVVGMMSGRRVLHWTMLEGVELDGTSIDVTVHGDARLG